MAVGVGFASANIDVAVVLMLAIGLQNVPEGLSVGFSLLATHEYSRRFAYIAFAASGFVEPPTGIARGARSLYVTRCFLMPWASQWEPCFSSSVMR